MQVVKDDMNTALMGGGKTEKRIFPVCIGIVSIIALPLIIGEHTTEDFLTVNATMETTTLGNNATYLITVMNTGNKTDIFNLTAINGDNASIALLSTTTLILKPGQSVNVLLNVTDNLTPGPYSVLVNATSQTTRLSDEVETITAVVEE